MSLSIAYETESHIETFEPDRQSDFQTKMELSMLFGKDLIDFASPNSYLLHSIL